MNHKSSTYKDYVERRAARSPVLRNCIAAFSVGGGICAFGQLLLALYSSLGAAPRDAGTLVTVSLIALAALTTSLGVFDTVARFAGAGTLVPVTGFANAVVSPAMDTKSEGLVLGTGAKFFILAGPVILYGTLAGTLYGLLYYLAGCFGWR